MHYRFEDDKIPGIKYSFQFADEKYFQLSATECNCLQSSQILTKEPFLTSTDEEEYTQVKIVRKKN